MPETRISDFLAFLRDLEASGTNHFLEGGQAVNFWAEYYSAKGTAKILAPFQPFTSKDCDIWASHAAVKYLRSKKDGGRLIEGTSPADGQFGVFSFDTAPTLSVDIMTNVYGIPQARLKQLAERALIVGGIRVIDPIFLFQSKCHCLLNLDQASRQDEKHVRMLCCLIPAHLEALLCATIAGHITQRALINDIKFLQTILHTSRVRRALQQIATSPSLLIPIQQMTTCGLEKVERFAVTISDSHR